MAWQHTTSALSDRLSENINDCADLSNGHLIAFHEASLSESAIITLSTCNRTELQTIMATVTQFNPRLSLNCSISSMRRRWRDMYLSVTNLHEADSTCYKKRKFVKTCNTTFPKTKQIFIVKASKMQRRAELAFIFGSSENFWFDGLQGCIQFLQNVFLFSNTM